jgi:hypothetical protein
MTSGASKRLFYSPYLTLGKFQGSPHAVALTVFLYGMKYRIQKTSVLMLLLVLFAFSAGAQETYTSSGRRVGAAKKSEPKGFDPQRLVIGGGFGLGFGDITSIAVSPVVGYRFTDNFLAGVGLGFQYFRMKDRFPVYNVTNGAVDYYPLKSTFFYPSLWARYVVYQNIFVHVEGEYDMQNFKAYENATDQNGDPVSYNLKYNSPALLLGAGLRQPVSERSSLVIMALYDVIQHEYSPYKNRIDFRIGFNAGF